MGLCEEICVSAMPLVSLRSETTWETDRSGSTDSLQGEVQEGFSEELVFELRLW